MTGEFAGDKDVARKIREDILKPRLLGKEDVAIDFAGVELATQSFLHALISSLVRTVEFDALAMIEFRNCNPVVRELIEIVADYSQEDVTDDWNEDEDDDQEGDPSAHRGAGGDDR
ncbi:MAG: STAS-like domain-containing protein [Actinobacteria bacterium]|nr:STAS-like domain-containing protein [Actinomycetota bacterium]